MAEVAAGVVAYEAAETVVQLGVGAWLIAQPTLPLKSRFKQLLVPSDEATITSLTRSEHSITVINDRAYIFGGEVAPGKLASNEVHWIALESEDVDHAIIPAKSTSKSGKAPIPRKRHATCAFNDSTAVLGGVDEQGQTIDSLIWLFDTAEVEWKTLDPSNQDLIPQPRSGARLFEYEKKLVLYGGFDASGTPLLDVSLFDTTQKSWHRLPDAPVSANSAAMCDGVLYVVSGTDRVGGDLHSLRLKTTKPEEEPEWYTIPFPTSPLTPGPLPRTAAGLLSVSTGYGRQYLLYLFGSHSQEPEPSITSTEARSTVGDAKEVSPTQYWSDMWACQIVSTSPEVKMTTNIYEAIKPAKIKDVVRGAFGIDSGKHSWAEVEVLPPLDLEASAGKVHPGPRASFACDVMKDGRSVVVWGGINPKGEREGDGWIIRLE